MSQSDFSNPNQAIRNALDNLIETGESLLSAHNLILYSTLDSVLKTAAMLGDSLTDVYISELTVLLRRLKQIPEDILDEEILFSQKCSESVNANHPRNLKMIDLISIIISVVMGGLALAQNAAYHNEDSQTEQEYHEQEFLLLKEQNLILKEIAQSKGSTEQSELFLQELKEILRSAPMPD